MSVTVELPALGESVVEGMVSRWLVKEGDRVEQDQPVVEITTDKVDAEIPAPEAGVVEKLLVAEGDTVPVGTALLTIEAGATGEAHADEEAGDEGAEDERTEEEADEGAPARRSAAPAEPAGESEREEDAPRATPTARKAAAARGVDLRAVEGTGVGGRVTRSDVESSSRAPRDEARPAPSPARSERARRPAPAPRPAPAARAPAERPAYLSYQLEEGDKVIPMTPLRRIVAEHMVLSKQTSPHVGTVAEIDMGGVVKVRDAHKRAFREQNGFNLTYLPFVVHVTVRALREFPRLNASVVEDAIVERRAINVGVAVETDKGLVVPVLRNADRLSLSGLAATIEDLSDRARSKKLSPDELQGGSFTVSNPGRHGNLYGFAIINQPQVGILRMGEIVKRPVVRTFDDEDTIVVRPIMHLALSYDHRAVDGAPANAFLHRVRELLEEAEFDL